MILKPRIGRQVKHFEKVDINAIDAIFSNEDIPSYRYTLSLPYYKENGRIKTAAVVLKNPSSADKEKADKTVQNVAKVIYKTFHDVGKVEILNMFALRGTFPKDVQSAYDNGKNIVGAENDRHFEEILSRSSYVVIAWGGAAPIKGSIYNRRIDEVTRIIEKSCPGGKIFRKSGRGSDSYPFHACYWPDNSDFTQILI